MHASQGIWTMRCAGWEPTMTMTTLMGCQGCDHTPTLTIKTCPRCGHEVEVFSIDTAVNCENCGQEVYNDAVSCVQWCKYARTCVGDQEYERLMEVARLQKQRQLEAIEQQRAQRWDEG